MYIIILYTHRERESRIGYASRVRQTETGVVVVVVVVVVVDKGRRVSRATAATAAVAVATTVYGCVCVCTLYHNIYYICIYTAAVSHVGFPDIRGLDHRKLCTQTLIARTIRLYVRVYRYNNAHYNIYMCTY